MRLLAVAAVVGTIGVGALSGGTALAQCRSDEIEVIGMVKDSSGVPMRDATVYVLLDQISQKKWAEQGLRARRFRTDFNGQFRAYIDCAEARSGGGPDPCAKKPKHVTVAADPPDHRLKLQVFKLKELEIHERGGVCYVRVPEIRVSAGY